MANDVKEKGGLEKKFLYCYFFYFKSRIFLVKSFGFKERSYGNRVN